MKPSDMNISKTTVLVVDDDLQLQTMMRLIFERRGVEVITATSAEEGVRLAHTESPSVILMDVYLQGATGNGWTAAQKIKLTPDLARIPIIMMSAGKVDFTEKDAIDLGCDAFLRKPFSVSILTQLVMRYLG